MDCTTVCPAGTVWTGTAGAVTIDPSLGGCTAGAAAPFFSVEDLDASQCGAAAFCGFNSSQVNFTITSGYPAVVDNIGLQCLKGNLRVYRSDIVVLIADDLTTVGGSVTVERNGGMTGASFDALPWIGSYLKVKSNPALVAINAYLLSDIGGNLQVTKNGSLPDLFWLDAVTSVGSYMTIEDNDALDLLNNELSSIATVGGTVTVRGNDTMTALDLSSLTSIAGELRIESNVLTDLDVSALTSVTSVTISQEPDLVTLGPAWALTSLSDNLELEEDDSLRNVNALAALTSVGGFLDIVHNHQLVNVSGLLFVASAAGIAFEGNYSLPAITMDALTTTGSFVLRDNAVLTGVSFAGLTNVSGLFRLENNDACVSTVASFPVLATVSGDVQVKNNLLLSSLTMESLASIGSTLSVTANPSLATVDLEGIYDATLPACGGGTVVNSPIWGTGSPGACADLQGLALCVGKSLVCP